MIKQLARRALNSLGIDVVRTRNSNESLSRHLNNVFASRNIDCVIDVGANAGQYGKYLREMGFRGHIVSFEPVRAVFDALSTASAKDARWSCHQLALGERHEEKTINVYKSTVFSSFLNANEYSKAIWRSLEHERPEKVTVVRLDEVFAQTVGHLGVSRCLLKLDTQGYDRFAFAGARGCLNSIVALQSELSLIPVYRGMSDPYDVLADFHKEGFFVSGMYPINREDSLAVIEYDCVLVKRSAEA